MLFTICTLIELFTEIWNLKTFWYLPMVSLNFVISDLQGQCRQIQLSLHLSREHHCTWHLNLCRSYHTTTLLTCGPLVWSSTSFLWEHLHSTLIVFIRLSISSSKIQLSSQTTCLLTSSHSYKGCWTKHQTKDLLGLNCFNTHLCWRVNKKRKTERSELSFTITGLPMNIMVVEDK